MNFISHLVTESNTSTFRKDGQCRRKSIPVHLLALDKVFNTKKGLETIERIHFVDFGMVSLQVISFQIFILSI